MTQYLMSVHGVEGQEPPSPEQMQTVYAAVDAFNKELQDANSWVFGGGLEPPQTWQRETNATYHP